MSEVPTNAAPQPTSASSANKKVRKGKKLLIFFLSLLILGGVAFGGYTYWQSTHRPVNPEDAARKEAEKKFADLQKKNEEIINRAKGQIALPTNETPLFATVSDPAQLKDQDFFKEAQVGDKIIMFPKNKKAYLYRPADKRVLAEAPLQYTVGQPATASVAGEAIAPSGSEIPQSNLQPNPTIIPRGKVLVKPQN